MSESRTVDVVVVGSGAAALATALGAIDSGLSVLLVEGSDRWGGNTAMSGGGLWLPNNPLMQRDAAGDSREEALAYLEACVGDAGRATSRARKEAFVDGIADLVETGARHGIAWQRAKDYPDYYPERPGGKIGRGLEVTPFDTNLLGEWRDKATLGYPIPITTDDFWLLSRSWSTPDGAVRGARVVARTIAGLVRGKRLAGLGQALAGALLHATVVTGGAELWLEAPLVDLVVEDGRVAGAVVERAGERTEIRATRGVMLAGGGFDQNQAMRREYQGIDGNPSGAPGNQGHPIEIAQRAGAALELMGDAWWGASLAGLPGGPGPQFIVGERSFPYSLMVDANGDRFANESESYVDLGHHMLERDKDGAYWLVTDARHARRYLRSFVVDPKGVRRLTEAGIVLKRPTLAALAEAMGVEPGRLRATVDRFNAFARTGVDADFGRGNSAYDRYYGDPFVHPNPNLGPLEKAPFHAYKVVIGDLGTSGGVLTDEHARALREDGSVIEGLYAAGNNSAAVMGHTYPGPGSTIGPAAVFGLIAARHLAGRAG